MGTKIIETLEDGEFTAPSYIHDSVKRHIMALATFCTPVYLEIREEAFRAIAHDECSNLINIGHKYKCHIEIQENIECTNCEIPQAATQDHVSNKLTAAAINIRKDDLAEQKVTILGFEIEL